MRLTLHSELMEHVVVVRCQGCIVAGAEVDALEAELEKHTEIRRRSFCIWRRWITLIVPDWELWFVRSACCEPLAVV